MKKIIISILFYFVSIVSFAQDQAQILLLSSPDNLFIFGWYQDSYQILDTAYMTLTYKLDHMFDTINGRIHSNIMVLNIGKNYKKYYSSLRDITDSKINRIRKNTNLTLGMTSELKSSEEETRLLKLDNNKNINGEIWFNQNGGTLTHRFHSLYRYNESIEYEEPIPSFKWELQLDTATICDYPCWLATTLFRGRIWRAWYTLDIPVSAGPWKFAGLPGLILRVEDSQGDYQWHCVEIKTKPTPIIYYSVPARRILRKQWLNQLRRIHEHPMDALAPQNGSFQVMVRGQWLDDSWSIPYNPIELE